MTVTAPLEPSCVPMKPMVLETSPPSSIVSVPVPNWPTAKNPPLVQVEPAPVTVAVPIECSKSPTKPQLLETLPPASIVSVPVPSEPTTKVLLLVQFEPAPVTVAEPVEPASSPRVPARLETLPPASINSVPAPPSPTTRLLLLVVHAEPAPVTFAAPFEPEWAPRVPPALMTSASAGDAAAVFDHQLA